MTTIGTCGNCGGEVVVPDFGFAPRCKACRAQMKNPFGPIIEMEPAARPPTPDSIADLIAKANEQRKG